MFSTNLHTVAEYKTEEEEKRGAHPSPPPPPLPNLFENGSSNISKLYFDEKGIYRRVRFYLDI